MRKANHKVFYNVFCHGIMIIAGLICLFPVYIMVMGSFKSSSELLLNSVGLPQSFAFTNYIRLWNYNSGTILRTYLNAIFVGGVYTFLAIIFASMAGFAFAKYNFKGKNTGIANVFAMFMFRKNMETIPDELLEAARVEGANDFILFTKIMVPVSKPVFGALSILVFLSKWNEFLLPKMFISKTELLPIMVVLPTLSVGDNLYAVPWELVLTGCTLVTIPLIIIFLMFQDKFLASVTIGAVKG